MPEWVDLTSVWIPKLSGWSFVRPIKITEQSGNNLSDYQVLIELNSSNFDFSKAKSDGSDIRFLLPSGKSIPYWIESWDKSGQNAKVWVKVPSLPANSSTVIYMYYGNPSATDESNGDAVFEFFDDFEDGSLDTTKWDVSTYSSAWHYAEENGYLKLWRDSGAYVGDYDYGVIVSSKDTFSYNRKFITRFKILKPGTVPATTSTDVFYGERTYIGLSDKSGCSLWTQSNYIIAINYLACTSCVDGEAGSTLGMKKSGTAKGIGFIKGDNNDNIVNLSYVIKWLSNKIVFEFEDEGGSGTIVISSPYTETDTSYIPTTSLYWVFENSVLNDKAKNYPTELYAYYFAVAKLTDPEPTYTVYPEIWL